MQRENEVQHVFLVGAKSLGAYGGYETFVYKLTEYHQNKKNIKYHVACKANGDGCMDETKVDGVTRINDHEFEFHNAHCFKIDIPQIGPAQAIYYDVAALKACCKYIKEHRIKHPIVYIMACRIGPFAGHFYKEIHKLGGTVYLNPDGHEWMRAKWSAPIRRYWKISEQMMVKYCDLAICDSVNTNGLNRFEMIFPNEVFDVNQMSEIVIPDLYYMSGGIQLKYPEGRFRYYFIDIGEIPTGQRGELFATYSGLALLVEKLQNNVEKLTEDSEIFVHFPNTSRPDYKKVYSMMARVLRGQLMPGKIKISLSPSSLETETE